MSAASPQQSLAKPGFLRVLRLRDLILYGLVILTPTAPYPVFGVVQTVSEGHAALAYVVAMVGMLFTAASYGKMAAAFPSAGSTYIYARRSLSESIGFLAGWAMILDYFLIPLLSVIYVGLTANRLMPSVPYLVWVVLFTLLIAGLNLLGIRMTRWASQAMMLVMSTCAVAFVVLAAVWLFTQGGWAGLFAGALPRPETLALRPLMLGAGIATLSYIGFDAISTLAEDTVEPAKTIPRATVLVCVLQAAICVLTVYLAARVLPDYRAYSNVETVILDISQTIGGSLLFNFVTVVLMVAGLASSLTGQAGASRLLFAMGRDGLLPSAIFAHLSPRQTPDRAIWFMTALTLAGALVIDFQLSVELLNFGAFVGFILVNLSVIRHYYVRLAERAGVKTWTNLVAPALGCLVCTAVWMSLNLRARVVGFGWLAIGLVYLAFLTRGFRVPLKPLDLS